MVSSEREHQQLQRRVLHEVARRIGIEHPDGMEENSRLLPAVEGRDRLLYKIMQGYRTTYRQWHLKRRELEKAAENSKPLTAIQTALTGLRRERDINRDSLVRYLDHHYPACVSRVSA
jgi:hypothetical protein